jgi:hypothetical protein
MRRPTRTAPFPDLPSPAEVANWNPSHAACSAEALRPDLNSPPGTPWNKSVTEVFVQSFLSAGFFECTEPDTIAKAFSVHLRTLREQYVSQHLSPEARAERSKKAGRAERKRNVSANFKQVFPLNAIHQLFHRRRSVAIKYPELRHHVDVISSFGVDGMSSDESDHESGVPRYRILQKSWRNPRVTPWLRIFDAIHLHSRWGPIGRVTAGSKPHTRVVSTEVDDTHPAVTHLPKNAYDTAWLDGLSEVDRRRLQPREEYDFSHSRTILEYVHLLLKPNKNLIFLSSIASKHGGHTLGHILR